MDKGSPGCLAGEPRKQALSGQPLAGQARARLLLGALASRRLRSFNPVESLAAGKTPALPVKPLPLDGA